MAVRLEVGAHRAEVVDLAVEDDRRGAVVARHRLATGDQIDDGQARHAEPGAVTHRHAAVIRTAVVERREHGVEHGR
jgi:hypothetical protein